MQAFTENGAVSLASTTDPRLDLFFKTVRDLGSFNYDDKENEYLFNLIDKSTATNALDTMKIIMNWRDCRGGKGDRRGFLVSMAYFERVYPSWFFANVHLIPEYGSYMDLVKLYHILQSHDAKKTIMHILACTLKQDMQKLSDKQGISLAAKWIPAERSKWDRYKNNKFLVELCRVFYNKRRIDNATLKTLRKDVLVPLRAHLHLVESNLCEKRYHDIEYSHVPSVAMNKYKTLFCKHDYIRFMAYMAKVKTGEVKINSDQVYPHDLVRQYLNQHSPKENPVIEAQWQTIKKKVQDTQAFDRSIVVCDVSGSMDGTPMEVAIALGLLGLYENKIITFSANPELIHVPDDSLCNQVKQLLHMAWGMNTNLERVLDLVLGLSARNPANAIKRIFIFSDMQFDTACGNNTQTHFELMREKFKRANVEMPQIIFWNLRGGTKDFPVSCNDKGVILLSGYSPSLLTSLLDNKEVSPMDVLMNVINSPRYDKIRSPEF